MIQFYAIEQLPIEGNWEEARTATLLPIETQAQHDTRLIHEGEVWGCDNISYEPGKPFRCRAFNSECESEYQWFDSYAPVTFGQWRRVLGEYIRSRTDLMYDEPELVHALYRGYVQDYGDRPLIAPILMDFLSGHPDRAAQWEWFVTQIDEMGDIITPSGIMFR